MGVDMKELREMTDKLPSLGNIIIEKRDNSVVYNVNGTALGFGLYNSKDVAVQRVFMSKDTTFDQHVHSVHEWGIVYKGKVVFHYDGEQKEVGEGQMIYLEPNHPHRGMILEDTWIIFITVPSDEGYPNG